MKEWSFYRKSDGAILPMKITLSDVSQLPANTPEGCLPILGHHDHEAQRVDLATGEVIDWKPPQPDANHEWDAGKKRWQLTAQAAAAARDHDNAVREIERLERAQLRGIRELAIDSSNKAAKDVVKSIDDQIAALRPAIMENPPRQKQPDIARAAPPVARVIAAPEPEPERPLPPARP